MLLNLQHREVYRPIAFYCKTNSGHQIPHSYLTKNTNLIDLSLNSLQKKIILGKDFLLVDFLRMRVLPA